MLFIVLYVICDVSDSLLLMFRKERSLPSNNMQSKQYLVVYQFEIAAAIFDGLAMTNNCHCEC